MGRYSYFQDHFLADLRAKDGEILQEQLSGSQAVLQNLPARDSWLQVRKAPYLPSWESSTKDKKSSTAPETPERKSLSVSIMVTPTKKWKNLLDIKVLVFLLSLKETLYIIELNIVGNKLMLKVTK